MPQIDFGKAFSDPDGSPSPKPSALPAGFRAAVEPSKFRRTRIGRSGWANIIFVIIAILGGLFCAFYFFDGAELLRGVARWPREFLYSQPGAGKDTYNSKALAASLGLPLPTAASPVPGKEPDHSGDPFSRAGTPLSSLNPPRSGFGRVSQTPIFSAPGAPGVPIIPPVTNPDPSGFLRALVSPVPGGDQLLHTFNQGVAALQRAKQADAVRTVNVVETRVARVVRNSVKKGAGAAGGAVHGVANTANGTVQGATGTTANGVNAASRTGGNTVNNTVGGVNSSVGSTGGPAGGVGSPGGLSGVGRAVGGLSGPGGLGRAGGALGGAGLGGLGGGRLGGFSGGGGRH